MIDAFQTYKYYTAVRLHLTTDRYDVFQSNGRVSGSRATFDKRPDRGLFEKIGRKFSAPRDLIEYFVANIAYGNDSVVYSTTADEYYTTWISRKESRTALFKKQMSQIYNHLELKNLSEEDLYSVEGEIPELLNLYFTGAVHLETMVILDELENFLPRWDCLSLIWGDQLRIINKIKKFVKFDRSKVELIYNHYREHATEL